MFTLCIIILEGFLNDFQKSNSKVISLYQNFKRLPLTCSKHWKNCMHKLQLLVSVLLLLVEQVGRFFAQSPNRNHLIIAFGRLLQTTITPGSVCFTLLPAILNLFHR